MIIFQSRQARTVRNLLLLQVCRQVSGKKLYLWRKKLTDYPQAGEKCDKDYDCEGWCYDPNGILGEEECRNKHATPVRI